ncbi:hypothetical protein ACTXT7_000718 [Hymenolepis weldensis]
MVKGFSDLLTSHKNLNLDLRDDDDDMRQLTCTSAKLEIMGLMPSERNGQRTLTAKHRLSSNGNPAIVLELKRRMMA